MSVETAHVVAAIIVRDGLFFVAKRNPGGPAGGNWEFPGGKVEDGEEPRQALARELKEELALDAIIGARLGLFETTVGAKLIALDCYFVHDFAGVIHLSSHSACDWVAKCALDDIDFASPDLPVVQALLSRRQ